MTSLVIPFLYSASVVSYPKSVRGIGVKRVNALVNWNIHDCANQP